MPLKHRKDQLELMNFAARWFVWAIEQGEMNIEVPNVIIALNRKGHNLLLIDKNKWKFD